MGPLPPVLEKAVRGTRLPIDRLPTKEEMKQVHFLIASLVDYISIQYLLCGNASP